MIATSPQPSEDPEISARIAGWRTPNGRRSLRAWERLGGAGGRVYGLDYKCCSPLTLLLPLPPFRTTKVGSRIGFSPRTATPRRSPRPIRRARGTVISTSSKTGRLLASQRPCCEASCEACNGRAADGHAHRKCMTSPYTRCRLIQVTPKSADPMTSRGALAREGDILGDAVHRNDFLAAESNSNEVHFLLVKAADDGVHDVPDGYSCPDDDANFDYPRGKKAIRAVRLLPVVTGRGDASVTTFELHSNASPLLVPCANLRVGKLALVRRDETRRAAPPRRTAVGSGAAPSRPAVYELPPGKRAEILERCGVY